jgi:hypothetical protein
MGKILFTFLRKKKTFFVLFLKWTKNTKFISFAELVQVLMAHKMKVVEDDI